MNGLEGRREGSVRDTQRECETDAGKGRGGREGCESWREGRGEAGVEVELVAGGRKSLCSARD